MRIEYLLTYGIKDYKWGSNSKIRQASRVFVVDTGKFQMYTSEEDLWSTHSEIMENEDVYLIEMKRVEHQEYRLELTGAPQAEYEVGGDTYHSNENGEFCVIVEERHLITTLLKIFNEGSFLQLKGLK